MSICIKCKVSCNKISGCNVFNEKPGQWHVLTTKPKNEKRAHDNLKAQGFEVFLPLIAQVKKRQGLKSVAIEPLFPNYLFVKFNQKILTSTRLDRPEVLASCYALEKCWQPLMKRL